MDINNSKLLIGGAPASEQATYVDDVFSTFLYDGTGSAQSINNGIDLTGEGGMVIIKNRPRGIDGFFTFDTERGPDKYIRTNLANAEQSSSSIVTAFSSTGFAVGTSGSSNRSGEGYVAWTFRKCPGFCDVVTYVGNGLAGRNIAHNLGSVPGMIIIKCLDHSENWTVWHRSLTSNQYLIRLNLSNPELQGGNGPWNNTAPTSSVFTLGGDFNVNWNNTRYVAYIFAHDDQSFGDDGNEAIIKCGSFTSTGSVVDINLGFEPQWLLVKRSDASNSWVLVDSMRGNPVGSAASYLEPNASYAESTLTGWTVPTPTGFTNNYPLAGGKFIYMAIRRPNKPPSAGTDVFAVDTRGSLNDGKEPTYRAPFPVDMEFNRNVNYAGGDMQISARLTQSRQMHINLTGAETGNVAMMFDYMNGVQTDTGTGSDQYAWMFKRAPGFFDVVTFTGDGQYNRQISHNLDAVPQLIIVKQRDATRSWAVYSAATGTGKFLKLEGNDAAITQSGIFDTAPTSSTFTVETNTYVNISGGEYIAYLFGNVNGISKVGSYTGTGSTIDVDCGFTSGARFVLIKRWDSPGNWILFDSLRGIVSGNDPFLALNTTDAQDSNYDAISPYGAGFVITATGPSDVNINGGSYLFLAIS